MNTTEQRYFLDKFLLGVAKRKREMEYEPLEITFSLSSPISLTFPWFFFDSLIGEFLLRDALKQDYYLLPTKFPFSKILAGVEIPPFPIKEKDGLYFSSVSIFDVDSKYLEVIYKKFEDRWVGGKRKIQKGSGYYRDYMIQHIYIPATQVKFYVCGDREVLQEICGYITGLGDNTRLGWGAVRSVSIKPIKEDYSLIKDGIAMRPIPKQFIKYAEEYAMLAWRPPYWEASHIDLCAVPFKKCELREDFYEI
jgi:hypothetical protein